MKEDEIRNKSFAAGIPEYHDPLVDHHAKWETHELQFTLLVWDHIKQRIFDARNELSNTPIHQQTFDFDRDQELCILVEREWSMDYTRTQVVPWVALHIYEVNNKVAEYPKSRYISENDLINYVVDLIDWKNFNVTGEFRDVETVAMAVDTRYQMEKNL